MRQFQVTVYGDSTVTPAIVVAEDYQVFYNDEGSERTLLQFVDTEQELVAEFSISANQSFAIQTL